jgi:GR25 family glycosyltransferase involved in LPS biosynthesis
MSSLFLVPILMYLTIFKSWGFSKSISEVPLKKERFHRPMHSFVADNLSFFWINLQKNSDRREYMEQYFQKHKLFSQQRVPAVEPDSPDFKKVKVLEKPCKRNTVKDISVVLSHLKAIYTAIYFDSYNPHSNYAVILEDDIKFLFSVNFTELISTAPKDFTILQLSTSNPEALQKLFSFYSSSADPKKMQLWQKTSWMDKTKNGKTYLYWAAQAYIINKERILKNFISYVMRTRGKTILEPNTPFEQIEYYIINSFFTQSCKLEMKRPCILSNCIFADSFIYSGGKPTYVSTIPLVTGAKVGLNSTIHQEEVNFHKEGFSKINEIAQKVKQELQFLPSYINKDLT